MSNTSGSAVASSASSAATEAAIRAALLANMNNTSSSTGAPSVPQQQKKPTIPEPPPPPKEDEVPDSGDAINTFASYIPTGLPPSVIKILQERAQASNNSNDTASTTFSGNSNLVDLSMDNKKDDDTNSIIEILDTDNEDSRMGMEDITNIADAKTNGLDQKQPSSSDTKPNSKECTIAHELFTSGKIQSHTSPAVESALLSSVSAPLVPNEACETILPLLKEGKLSPLQAEGVSLAVSRFNRVFVSKGSGKGDGSMRAG